MFSMEHACNDYNDRVATDGGGIVAMSAPVFLRALGLDAADFAPLVRTRDRYVHTRILTHVP